MQTFLPKNDVGHFWLSSTPLNLPQIPFCDENISEHDPIPFVDLPNFETHSMVHAKEKTAVKCPTYTENKVRRINIRLTRRKLPTLTTPRQNEKNYLFESPKSNYISLQSTSTQINDKEPSKKIKKRKKKYMGVKRGYFCANMECWQTLQKTRGRSPYCSPKCQSRAQNIRQKRVYANLKKMSIKTHLLDLHNMGVNSLPESAIDILLDCVDDEGRLVCDLETIASQANMIIQQNINRKRLDDLAAFHSFRAKQNAF
ncbi:hypothetical protein PCE1_003995 [Barthelona sp. PCE]